MTVQGEMLANWCRDNAVKIVRDSVLMGSVQGFYLLAEAAKKSGPLAKTLWVKLEPTLTELLDAIALAAEKRGGR